MNHTTQIIDHFLIKIKDFAGRNKTAFEAKKFILRFDTDRILCYLNLDKNENNIKNAEWIKQFLKNKFYQLRKTKFK